MSTRPEFYDVRMLNAQGTVRLCRCCFAVMANEGVVAGDPTLPGYEAAWAACSWPVYGAKIPCANCEAIRQFEEKRARLAEPPKRLGEVVQ